MYVVSLFCSVDCVWGDWVLGQCSTHCGGGIQIDSRVPLQPALFGGNPCQGDETRPVECNMDPCPGIEIF